MRPIHLNLAAAMGVLALVVASGGAVAVQTEAQGNRTPPTLIYRYQPALMGNQSTNGLDVACPSGREVLGGGVTGPGANADVWVASTAPIDFPPPFGDEDQIPDDGWYGYLDDRGGAPYASQVGAHAICASGFTVAP